MAAIDGENSLEILAAADPPLYISPCPDLSRHARIASRHLYSSLLATCPKPKPPLDDLLVDQSFDAEQIWCQIELISRPIVSMLRREVYRIEKDPPKPVVVVEEVVMEEEEEEDEVEEEEEEEDEEADEEVGEEDEGEGESEDEEGRDGNGLEDKFFKMDELEEYLEKDEEREFGEIKIKHGNKDEEENEDGDEEDDDEIDLQFGDVGGDDEDNDANAKYDDFFGGKKERGGKKKVPRKKERTPSDDDEPEELASDDKLKDDSDVDIQENKPLSTHEKQLLKVQSKIKQMEKQNMEPKFWTMQGEVTAAKRPKNSALEVDLDFDHNMRPPPTVTEEFTASLEDLIKKRIIEGHFDDVQRAPALPSKAPKELKELDENKSKKGLAEIYEEEYAHQTGLTSAPLSSSDEQKKETSNLFKMLCLKLDALSHFHFAPKPVIDDMSIQSNVPALAMEEIAPVAVSDAAMLAPEEVFKGQGDIKEESELTQVERKRRRANKKRKFKAETAKKEAKKAKQGAALGQLKGNEDS